MLVKHMVHHKFGPSSDVWTCVHGIGYPDECSECIKRVTVVHGMTEDGPIKIEITKYVRNKETESQSSRD
jgi:hypothetical protein